MSSSGRVGPSEPITIRFNADRNEPLDDEQRGQWASFWDHFVKQFRATKTIAELLGCADLGVDEQYARTWAWCRAHLGMPMSELEALTAEEILLLIESKLGPANKAGGKRARSGSNSDEQLRRDIRKVLDSHPDHQTAVRELDRRGIARPTRAAWRHLTWEKAFREYRGAVDTYLSKLRR
jgi:hypothetical protein